MSGCSFGCCGAALTVVVVGEGPNVTADDANGDTSYDRTKQNNKLQQLVPQFEPNRTQGKSAPAWLA
jgi:hypothetical protein